MKRRLALVSEIIAPYRIPVFNALAARDDIDLHVIFLSETDPSLRRWPVYKDEIRFSYEVLPAWRRRMGKYNLLINRGVRQALRRRHAQALLCGGYSYLAAWQAGWWARRHNIPLLLWSESTVHDLRHGHPAVEFMKVRFARWCKAFVVPGQSSREYLIAMGAPSTRIFTAPNAVDAAFYARLATTARGHAQQVRARYELPARYFLYAGRLVPEKGVFDLLAAYARLDESERFQIGLVFAGDGPARHELEHRAASIRGTIRFSGFVHREQLAELYALAEGLVFPTYSDTWGLVVNEAMACGLPVIASGVAGCVADLVRHGENGFVVPPRDIGELVNAMRNLTDSAASATMGAQSAFRIRPYTPEACAEGIAGAVAFACTQPVNSKTTKETK